jgi:hypothetical protein
MVTYINIFKLQYTDWQPEQNSPLFYPAVRDKFQTNAQNWRVSYKKFFSQKIKKKTDVVTMSLRTGGSSLIKTTHLKKEHSRLQIRRLASRIVLQKTSEVNPVCNKNLKQ